MQRELGKLYQDPLYGAKVLSPLAVAIIDTPEFQRLAEMRQLGFADAMYRGARHTRFEHSVGVHFITRTIMRRIVQNHERLGLDHPGKYLSTAFRQIPANSDLKDTTFQARWRGATEAVSAAALIHDLSHVPFGHTLEDELAGVYRRHDRLAGHRLYEMLFNKQSELHAVFSQPQNWVGDLGNDALRRLIYLILNWKEKIEPPQSFSELVEHRLHDSSDANERLRLSSLRDWHNQLRDDQLFQPFMSDVIGNTICADLLDYLPRDRKNLGMEPRFHTRLQRYFTVRPGSLHADEGYRVSIMVTRKGQGGQRRDVATAVLDIMRERYEMAERVFYHHKKAAASAMLAKLVDLSGKSKPRDDMPIYPAPWQVLEPPTNGKPSVPHMVHLSDSDLLSYLGTLPLRTERERRLQHTLYAGLRFRRRDVYRTLLVIDPEVANSQHTISFFTNELRGTPEAPSNKGRLSLEKTLAACCGAEEGDVLIYCPAPDMQAKEVDVRLEIVEDRVIPLRVQEKKFAYNRDLSVLQQYYEELWRAYIFVAAPIFEAPSKCQAIVDTLCDHWKLSKALVYMKVRNYDFGAGEAPATPSLGVNGDLGARLSELHGVLISSLGPAFSEALSVKVDSWAAPRLRPLTVDQHFQFLAFVPSKISPELLTFNRTTSLGSVEPTRLLSMLEEALKLARRTVKSEDTVPPIQDRLIND